MVLVKFQRHNGGEVIINPDHIISIQKGHEYTTIQTMASREAGYNFFKLETESVEAFLKKAIVSMEE